MPLSDFRDTYSWQGAIELGPQLVRLAEELPAAEQMGLAFQLRQSMVDLPAAVALDLLEGGSNTRRAATVRLVASIDLIEKVYPALDTGDVRDAVEELTKRLASDRFGEQTAGAADAYLPGADGSPKGPAVGAATPPPDTATNGALPESTNSAPPASVPVLPQAEAPTSVAPVAPAPMPQPAPTEPAPNDAPLKVAVQTPEDQAAPQENHVQPDRVQ